ncbi:MAG: cytochrome d ubiquinol oxidase subunit II [Solirubrobacterales bacterium]
MSKADIVAAILWAGATLYAVFGGADFGAGVWALLASRDIDAERRNRVNQRIGHSLGPVWEANHVWLIFALVVAWTAFPDAFAAIMESLYLPLALAAVGIVMRGSGFAFGHVFGGRGGSRSFAVFSVFSLITPFFMGTVVGAIASGEVPAEGSGDPTASWTGVLPLLIGVMFVAAAAYLAAVFLVRDAGAYGDSELQRYFARRALAAAVVAGLAAAAGIAALRDEARFVYDGLLGPGLPLVVLSGVCGLAAIALLARGVSRGFGGRAELLLRPAAVGAVVAVIWGWFVAQHPYLLPTQLTIEDAAGASAALTTVIVVFGIAAVTCVPALGLLYVLQQRERLE